MSYRLKASLGCALLLVIDLIIYLSTLAPSVGFIDSGELAVVCHSLGIAHPTGYPLYTLLGRLFCLLPFGNIIFRVNFMSLLLICLSGVTLFFIILTVMRDSSKAKQSEKDFRLWAAFTTSLIFSFTPTLWSQATSNEVYSLNVLLFGVLILLTAIWRNVKAKSTRERLLYLLAFVYALSFGNHMSTILLLPALFFILIATYGKYLLEWRRPVLISAFFLLGLSVYLFLPIRSAQDPIMDWGNPQTWANFVRHVTGWQYQVWMFAQSAGELGENLWNFIKLFFHQFPLYLLPFSLLGMGRLFVTDRKMFFFLLLLFSANVVYGINYGIPDIDPYFLGSFLTNAIFVGVGFNYVFGLIDSVRIKKWISFIVIMLFVLFPLSLLKKNYHQVDRSPNDLAYDFASNLIRSVRKDAVILTNVWDHYSPWLYLRFVENRRPDVHYLDTELCRRTWYFDYVKQNYGDLYDLSRNEIKKFLFEVQPFEKREPFDPNVIERAYVNMLNSLLIRNFKSRSLYDDLISGPKIGKEYFRIPEGMVFSLKDSLSYYPYHFPEFDLRGVIDEMVFKDERTLFNLRRYSFMIDLRLRYLSDFKQEDEANKLLRVYKAVLSERFQ